MPDSLGSKYVQDIELGDVYEAQFQVGNQGLLSPQLDFSSPLTSDGRVRYRLNALYRHEDSLRDKAQDFKRFFVAPVVSWQISDRTELTVQLEYSNDKGNFDVGLPAFGTGIVDVPFDRLINEPSDRTDNKLLNVGYNLAHRFSDSWQIRNAFRYTNRDLHFNRDLTQRNTFPYSFVISANSFVISANAFVTSANSFVTSANSFVIAVATFVRTLLA
ncbi:MAG: hypothetical protein V7L25_26655 [Nostoc sp.]|uniref:hypothetical protein n=1 Tax=Nostoc sp. TaxID=1180 RepID=UPI002FF21442